MFIGLFPAAKKIHPNLQPTTVLFGWHAWGQPGQLQQQISLPPSLSLTRSALSPYKKKWEETGDVVESKSNMLKNLNIHHCF